MEFDEIYQLDKPEVRKALSNIGIDIMKNEIEQKSDLEILNELSVKWEELSTHKNRFIKEWICQTIAGIKDSNLFKLMIDKLSKK